MSDLFDFKTKPAYGTPPRELVRSGDPETSAEAAKLVDTTRLEAMVHRAIHARSGVIASDLLLQFPHYPYSSITARFAALERKGFISCGPDKLPGQSGRKQRVMRSIREPAQ